ncbi:MAG: AraC family transcriptional regulator [Novosphingobium sp.]
MNWTLSEYLNLLELGPRRWCSVTMGARSGFRVPHDEAIFMHAFMDGQARITTTAGQVLDCRAGDIAIVLTGEAHKVRNAHGRTARTLNELLDPEGHGQLLPAQLGSGAVENRIISGSMRVAWPTGIRPARLPAMLLLKGNATGIDIAKLTAQANLPGGEALLGGLAKLLFIQAFMGDPQCRAQIELNLDDPIARAQAIIARYPFEAWNVGSLAARVGMGRSNFARRFLAETGKTPIENLSQERMKRAAAMLGDGPLKIAELSERIGYRSEAAFIVRFKREFGMTPAQWRLTHRAAIGT